MGLIQNLVSKMKGNNNEFKEKFKAAQEEMKINQLLEERQKSSNRRELERYMKEQEESEIKKELDKIHHQNNKEMWKSKNMILKKDKSILNDDRPILKEKNIFSMKAKKKEGCMFFKW